MSKDNGGPASDKIQQARRAAFEAAYLKQYFYPAERWSLVPEKYRTQHAEIAWWAFNAALDCVLIELPEPHSTNGGDCVVDYEETRAAIESTDLGIKVK